MIDVPRFGQVGFYGCASSLDIFGKSIRMGIFILVTFDTKSQSPNAERQEIAHPSASYVYKCIAI